MQVAGIFLWYLLLLLLLLLLDVPHPFVIDHGASLQVRRLMSAKKAGNPPPLPFLHPAFLIPPMGQVRLPYLASPQFVRAISARARMVVAGDLMVTHSTTAWK